MIQMNVKAYKDPDNPPKSTDSFCTVSLGATEDPLLEKELLHLVKARLIEMGFSYDEKDPAILVGLTGFIGPYEKYIPPTTYYWPLPNSSSSRTVLAGAIGEQSLIANVVTRENEIRHIPIARPGSIQTEYYRVIHVYFGKVDTLQAKAKVKLIWSGTVESAGQNADLLHVAPAMINELLDEYPERSGKPTYRTYEWPITAKRKR
jgi:hypothetical protein